MRPFACHVRSLLLGCVAATVLSSFAQPALAQARKDDDDDDKPKQPLTEIVVTARRLDAARASVEPSLGASSYAVSNDVVENRPGGESANLVHVLIQMPGVVQSGSGELNVRAQSNLQYRINNIIVPDGFTDLADTLRARFADNVQLVTGALPAQYGLQVGGIVNITTKNGVYEHGGEAEAYGGSHGHAETAFEAAGSAGKTNFYASASYLHDNAGTGSIDGSANPKHDRTDQIDGFTFIDHIIDAQSRASLIAGVSDDRNELPGGSGGRQRNQTAYGIVSYQRTSERLTYQVAGSLRDSALRVEDEPLAALRLAGLGEAVRNNALSVGGQAEGVYDLNPVHKLRGGVVATVGRDRNDSTYTLLPLTAAGAPGQIPTVLAARSTERRVASSLFAEDEWRVLEPLTVNYGVRFDDVTGEGGGHQLSPRLNAAWEVTSGTTIHAGYARYLVPAPETQEAGWPKLLAGTTGAPPGPPGLAARAETDNYYDIGLEQTVEDLRLGVDAYWRDATNLLDKARVGASSLRRPFNFAEGRVRGVEFNATYADGPLTGWANLALARAEGRRVVSGEASFAPGQLAVAADHFIPTNEDQAVTASLGSSYHWHAFRVSADAIYGSGLPRTAAGGAPNGSRLPSYVQVNLSVVYRLDGMRDRPLDLRVDVINLADRRYELQDGTSLAGGLPQWGARRGVFFGLEQQF